MKIVDRKTFLQMPKGTVFCKIPLNNEGDGKHYLLRINAPSVLEEASGVDFHCTNVGSDLWPKAAESGYEADEMLYDMQYHLGKEVPFEHCSGRDGLYEDSNVGFAIYSRKEVQEMINILQQALKDGYGINTQGKEDF